MRPAGHRRHRTGGVYALPDPTQFDAKSPYFDATSKPDEPRWLLVDVQVLRKGNCLSTTPVEPQHWRRDFSLLDAAPGQKRK